MSPYLFTLVMDDLAKSIHDVVSWCMMFANDIILVDEITNILASKLERWREVFIRK